MVIQTFILPMLQPMLNLIATCQLFVFQKLDAILNSFCNDFIYPDDASCCRDLEKVTQLQFNTFAMLSTWYVIFVLTILCVFFYKNTNKNKMPGSLFDQTLKPFESQGNRPKNPFSGFSYFVYTAILKATKRFTYFRTISKFIEHYLYFHDFCTVLYLKLYLHFF